ncbi:CU044_5270 family protein [Nonomuraea sp. H19]|uniref:CU044_5270 family protein n=1 Tax=Nonomuraea sp. H19 TaxID=3452206 RepID=UPI003F8C1E23
MNDLDLIQDLRSEVRQSDPATLHAARERLLAAMNPASPTRRPRPTMLRLVGVGALGLTIALGVTVVQGSDGAGVRKGTATAPAWASVASAERLAERATAAAAKATDAYPRADQWLYTKSLTYVSDGESMPGAGKTQTYERWQKGDGTKTARRQSHGNTDKGVPPIGADRVVVATAGKDPKVPRWDPAYLRSLPLDPDALMERLRKDGEDRPDLPESLTLFQQVQMILQEGAPPPRLRAALYTVASKLEGVGVEEKVRDLADREGVGIYLDRADGTRHEIIVDPNSHAYLGGREIFIGGGKRTSHSFKGQYAEGDVIIAWAQTARGIVDRAGDLP